MITTLTSGTLIADRYRIVRLLGQGGMGAVYLAEDLHLRHRLCALKENLDTSVQAAKMFENEAVMLATLRHPNLPEVTDHFTEPTERQYLVMDYIDGDDLDVIMQRVGKLPESQSLAWFSQVLDAVEYLHQQQPPVIHRDIKPANIKVTPHKRIVLVDFGIAKTLIPGQTTVPKSRAGTPGFAPPEQYTGGTDVRSDVYSLGATLYFMLTGQAPPDAAGRAAGISNLVSPRQIDSSISPQTATAVLQAIETDARKRFQSVGELRQALYRRGRTSFFSPAWQTATIGLCIVVVLGLGSLAVINNLRGFQSFLIALLGATTPTPTVSSLRFPPLSDCSGWGIVTNYGADISINSYSRNIHASATNSYRYSYATNTNVQTYTAPAGGT